VHLVPRLRGERAARHLPELRRRAGAAPGAPRSPAQGQPAVNEAGRPPRLRCARRSLITSQGGGTSLPAVFGFTAVIAGVMALLSFFVTRRRPASAELAVSSPDRVGAP
jgi:hypothetical protein